MSVIKADDIVGYFIGEECVCCDCATKDEAAEASLDEVVTMNMLENGEEIYFCDRCKKQIG